MTGASGRIGLPLTRALADAGHHVVGLARDDAKARAVQDAGAASVLIGTLEQEDVLAEGARGAAWVLHLAGATRGPGQITPDIINRQGTAHLIAALGRPGVADALERLLFTSTCAVYGDRSNLWVPEDMRPTPSTRYGKSKVDAEEALLGSGLPVIIARLAAVYGPGFPFLMADRLRDGKGWLPGEGRNYVPTVHIDDAVRALVLLAGSGELGGIYHVADQEPVTLKEFYGAVQRRFGGTPMRFWSTWIPSYVQHTAARNNERLQSRLGRRPMFTPDNLKLFTSSVRLRVERLEKELGFTWQHPRATEGVAAIPEDATGG